MINVILDTDIADDIDDAFALEYLLKNQNIFNLLGVVTVFKNVKQRALIVKKMLRLAGKDNIPVVMGENNPLKGSVSNFAYEEVKDGEINLLSYKKELENEVIDIKSNGVDFILNQIKLHPHEITLIVIGPETNIAKAIIKDKETMKLVKEIAIMGLIRNPNLPEWNILCDPEASKIVFDSGIPIRVVGADITCQTEFRQEELKAIRTAKGKLQLYINEMMEEWIGANKRPPMLHDCLPISSYINDKYLEFNRVDIDINLNQEDRGKAIITQNDESHIQMAYKFNRDLFMNDFINTYIKELK